MTHVHDIPPLAALLARAAPGVHPLITRLYDRLLIDTSIGKTREQTRNILNCGATTERQKEKDGILKTYVDRACFQTIKMRGKGRCSLYQRRMGGKAGAALSNTQMACKAFEPRGP